MSRYRPPEKPKSPYITAEGEKALKDELYFLWKVERPKVTQSVSDAAKLGDRSENAEYIYGKKRLREIDRRVRYLQKRLDILQVVDQQPDNPSKIYFGAWVEIVNQQEEIRKYRLVGPDEINPSLRYISIDSVMGKALLGKQVDDLIKVKTPGGLQQFEVLSIEYPANTQDKTK